MKRLVPVLVVVTAGIFLGGGSAQAQPACPLVTHNAKLSSDCHGPLVVARSGVHVNLRGHTVSCEGERGDTGVIVIGLSEVTIRNGTVADCGTGVLLKGGGDHVLRGLDILRNSFSPVPGPPTFDTGEEPLGEGVLLVDSDGNELARLDAERNASAIVLGGSSDNRILGGTFDDNHSGFVRSNGITMLDGSDDNQVFAAKIERNGDFGVFIDHSDRNSVRKSQVRDTALLGIGTGIEARDASGTVLASNVVEGNYDDGIALRLGATGAVVQSNSAFGNGPGRGFDLRDDNPSCDGNLWLANSFGSANQLCIG